MSTPPTDPQQFVVTVIAVGAATTAEVPQWPNDNA